MPARLTIACWTLSLALPGCSRVGFSGAVDDGATSADWIGPKRPDAILDSKKIDVARMRDANVDRKKEGSSICPAIALLLSASGSIVVPAGCTQITLKAWGGGGGGGGDDAIDHGGDGGGAGHAEETLAVSAGTTFEVVIGRGGLGGGKSGACTGAGGAGGYPGGNGGPYVGNKDGAPGGGSGAGGAGGLSEADQGKGGVGKYGGGGGGGADDPMSSPGGGGGGATTIRSAGSMVDIVVAGGGGGGGSTDMDSGGDGGPGCAIGGGGSSSLEAGGGGGGGACLGDVLSNGSKRAPGNAAEANGAGRGGSGVVGTSCTEKKGADGQVIATLQ